jgi:type II secretory pathway pseudopilin PulG
MTNNPYESPKNKTDLPQPPSDWLASTLRLVALLSLLGLLLLMVMPRWPLGSARESARRVSCINNLHNIALALHSYESVYRSLPPAYTIDAAGNPLHSWRTLILPYLDQKRLYDQIDLSKPWDDPTNRAANETSLKIYQCSSAGLDKGQTTYLAVVAPGGCFQPTKPTPLAAITDSHDLTFMVIEVAENHAVHWMSPNDASQDFVLNWADEEYPHAGGAMAVSVSGSILHVPLKTPGDILSALISINGSDDGLARKY